MAENDIMEKVELRGDGRPIRDFPSELSKIFNREFPDAEELFHKVATRLSRLEASIDA